MVQHIVLIHTDDKDVMCLCRVSESNLNGRGRREGKDTTDVHPFSLCT